MAFNRIKVIAFIVLIILPNMSAAAPEEKNSESRKADLLKALGFVRCAASELTLAPSDPDDNRLTLAVIRAQEYIEEARKAYPGSGGKTPPDFTDLVVKLTKVQQIQPERRSEIEAHQRECLRLHSK